MHPDAEENYQEVLAALQEAHEGSPDYVELMGVIASEALRRQAVAIAAQGAARREAADKELVSIFEEYVRRPAAEQCTAEEKSVMLALARTVYAKASTDHRRHAYWAYAARGWKLEPPPPAVFTTFVLGDEGDDADQPLVLAGYDVGQRWNGWCAPRLTKAGVRAFVAWMEQQRAAEPHGDDVTDRYTFDEDEECLRWQSAEYPEETTTTYAAMVATEDGPMHLWEVSFGLTWMRRDDNEGWRKW